MLNSNKRSLEINTKTPEGQGDSGEADPRRRRAGRELRPGRAGPHGLHLGAHSRAEPASDLRLSQGLQRWLAVADLKVYENVAQCAGGAASTTGFWDGPPTVSGAALGDSNTGMHLLIGILTALMAREKTGKGQKVSVSMQDAVLNLAASSCATRSVWSRVGYLEEYPQYPNGTFTDTVPRGGNAGGGGQPGWVLKCKGWETDPNAYIYFTIQEQNWARTCRGHRQAGMDRRPDVQTPRRRASRTSSTSSTTIEKWLADKTKYEAVDILRKFEVPCAPVLSMKEIAYDPALRAAAPSSRSPHKERGKYLTVGCPSSSPTSRRDHRHRRCSASTPTKC